LIAVRLVTYRLKDDPTNTPGSVGVLLDGTVIDLNAAIDRMAPSSPSPSFASIDHILLAGRLGEVAEAVHQIGEAVADGRLGDVSDIGRVESSLVWLPPVIRPTKVIGVGMNYHSFVAQIDEETPAHPTIFIRLRRLSTVIVSRSSTPPTPSRRCRRASLPS
jgi:2-keto-4-pentenoate hydratase/2-oxohepta-3-ene-1,7-dioic acid hydratase in catechol pathway